MRVTMMRLFNLLLSPIGRVASWPMRNIETFPSKRMYLYLSLVKRKVAEFYHNIDRRRYLVWFKWLIFITFSGQLMVSLEASWTFSVSSIHTWVLLISEFFPPWFHLLAARRPRLPSRWRRRWPLPTLNRHHRSRTCPMVQLREIPLPLLPLRQLPPSRLPPHQQTYLNKSPTFDKQKLELAVMMKILRRRTLSSILRTRNKQERQRNRRQRRILTLPRGLCRPTCSSLLRFWVH